ncbi:MAG: lytic transglycosylase domain-containing protein [Candidatus Bipolaricaulia bacterium]
MKIIQKSRKSVAVFLVVVSLFFLQVLPGKTLRASDHSEVSGRLARAVEAIEREEYREAVKLLEDYPKGEPLPNYSRYVLSRALAKTENYQRALTVLQKIPAGEDGVLLRYEKTYLEAHILSKMGQADRALELAEGTHRLAVTGEERKRLYELEFTIASESSSPQVALEKAIEYCEASELRFIGLKRDKLFDKIETIVNRTDFSDGQGLQSLYRYIELLIDYGEYRRARTHLLRNMGKWEGALRAKAYFTLAWLDGFKLDFPEEARWTFTRLIGTNQNKWIEAKARYYYALFNSRTQDSYDLVKELLEVHEKFPQTTYGKLAARRAFKERTKGAGLGELENQLELLKSSLTRSSVRQATWDLFHKSFSEGKYSLGLYYLRKLESFYETTPPELVFWRYKTKKRSNSRSGDYLNLVGAQKNNPLNYYSLLAKAKGWSREGFELRGTWDKTDTSLSEREAKIVNRDLSAASKKTLKTAISLKNHGLFAPALRRLERIKSSLGSEDYLFLKSHWESLAGEHMDSLKAATQLLTWLYEQNRVPPLEVVELAFPTYYGEEVERIAGKFGVPESLVFAIIRQESAFSPQAYSSSGAQGLMQVMPATAKGIADDLNMTNYEPGDGFKPAVNIQMGTYYISKQVSNWGRIRLGLVAYHGGPGNLGDWKSRFGTDELDLFVERIPAGSTRNYVKAVYRNYLVYKELL